MVLYASVKYKACGGSVVITAERADAARTRGGENRGVGDSVKGLATTVRSVFRLVGVTRAACSPLATV